MATSVRYIAKSANTCGLIGAQRARGGHRLARLTDPAGAERESGLHGQRDLVELELATTMILVDTPHQLLVNKLCALLSRSELRDLVDVRELLRGGDLERALEDCPRQDAGFSPLTFG